ncbi:MAG: hypothetical protein A2Y40_08145 [Candidatus Margulisbacteria bacterium GWF2_35_9]|nr:MAG: hypothetical protein A2Y40_08145 [Candidatus Margulisbacteria bacterium GWF2_35_9]
MKIIKANYQIDATIQTIVGFDSHLSGNINTESSIRFEGSFSGEINSQGVVYIGNQSIVKANINALRVIVSGEVQGDIEVIDSIDIMSSGKVIGNISGKKLVIDEGAVFQGKVNMDIISPAKVTD